MKKLLFISLAWLSWLLTDAEPPAAPKKSPAPLSLIVELTDGSRLMGTAEMDKLPFIAKYGRMDLVMKEVAAVTLGEDRETGKVTMKNGDGLQGVLDIGDLKLRTLMGEVSLPIRHVLRITAGEGWLPPDVFGPPGKLFEVPLGAKDQYGNPIRRGPDPKTGLPLEIRHKATGVHLVFISAGEFMMGSPENEEDRHRDGREGPVHKVRITEPFYIGKYEITQTEWLAVMDANPSKFKGDRNPVDQVSWNHCQEFIRKLNERLPLPSRPEPRRRLGEGRGEGSCRFSLPTEAQWEYACRAGTRTRFHWGNDETRSGEHVWSVENAGGRTHRAGQKLPNAWRIYDMPGNVCEWCQDRWHANYAGAPSDGRAWTARGDHRRVLRGAGHVSPVAAMRSANRSAHHPSHAPGCYGCRVALAIPIEGHQDAPTLRSAP